MNDDECFLLCEKDGTSPTAHYEQRGVALDEEAAKAWAAQGAPGYMERTYWALPIIRANTP